MKRWQLVALLMLCAAGLQACDREPPRTVVLNPGPSLPDDTVLHGPGAGAAQAAASAPVEAAASAPVQAAARAPAPAQAAASAPQQAQASASAPQREVDAQAAAQPQRNPDAAAQAQPAAPATNALGGPPAPAASAPAGDAAAAPSSGTAAPTEMSKALGAGAAASSSSAGSGHAAPASNTGGQKVSAWPAVRDPGDPLGAQLLAQRPLAVPVAGVVPVSLADTYDQGRGKRRHEATDILAPAGTPVMAVDDGRIARLFNSKPGGITIYQFDPSARLAYYYAHLQRYADGLHEGMDVRRGELIGYVGSTGNADPGVPHLHFAVFRLGTPPKWWQGAPVNPYPALVRAQAAAQFAAR
jgi:peptidoglycan LD-endopeptidase LytH